MKIILVSFSLALLFVGFSNAQVVEKEKDEDLSIAARTRLLINLSYLNQQVKTLDSATIKVFLRIETADFIWKRRISEEREFAESLLEDAIKELQTRKAEIPGFYQISFQTDIISSLKRNSPDFFQKVSKKYGLEENDYAQSYNLISKRGNSGISKAIEQVKKSLSDQDVSSDPPVEVVFMIEELTAQNKIVEANSILEFILTSFEKSAGGSYELFLYLNKKYTSPTTSIDLQKRFLRFIIAAGQSTLQKPNLNALDLKKRQNIYQILDYNLLKIQTILPSDFPQALAVKDILQKSMTDAFKERAEINKRINESKDKLNQTVSEAEKAEVKLLKNDLWEQAAALALEEKKFSLAVDYLEKVESSDENFLLRHDQFLDDEVTKSALKEMDVASAEYAVRNIKSKLRSGLADLQIVKFYHVNKDTMNAQLALNNSIKKIQSAENDAQKIRGLSNALNAAFSIDKDSLFNIAETIVKIVNSIPVPSLDEKEENESRKQYVNDVQMVVAWNILASFRVLARHNSEFARSLTSSFTQHEYRAASLLGVEIGLFEIEGINKAKKNVVKKASKQ